MWWRLALAALGGGLAVNVFHKSREKKPPSRALGLAPVPSGPLLRPPPGGFPPQGPIRQPGQLTPQRAAVHGELMERCIDPAKLVKAAHLFGAEGLPYHADALMRQAGLIHQMMQGAGSIVERCRAGDQHTMAIAKAIGERAKEGDKRAQLSAWLINEYSKANPAQSAQPTQAAA